MIARVDEREWGKLECRRWISTSVSSTTIADHPRLPTTHPSFDMASDLSVDLSQHKVAYESVESLRVQIKDIEDKWNDELKRLETARKDKEELEQILRVLQALVEYEREATLKMETMLQETRGALGIPDEASRPILELEYDPSRSTGSSSSGNSSVLEFDLVYNPNAAPKVPLETPSVSSPSSLSDVEDQAISVPPLLPIPLEPALETKRSPNWKSRITSILASTNNHDHSSSTHSLNSASSHDAKPEQQKRPSQDSGNHGIVGWRRTMGSAGNKFSNRASRDTNRKKPRILASTPQS